MAADHEKQRMFCYLAMAYIFYVFCNYLMAFLSAGVMAIHHAGILHIDSVEKHFNELEQTCLKNGGQFIDFKCQYPTDL